MTHSFAAAMMKKKETWNGAPSLSNPDPERVSSGRLSLFYRSVRGLNAPRLFDFLNESMKEDKIDTILLIFHIRDCRSGKGERQIGRLAFRWLFVNYPNYFSKIYELIPEYGRWDDLLDLWPNVLDLSQPLDTINANWYSNIKNNDELNFLKSLQKKLVNHFANQLSMDLERMKSGLPVSLIAKWAPTEKDSLDFKHKTVSKLCKALKVSPRNYRKIYTTPLREYLNVVEKMMCTNNWGSIDYSKVPSCAMKRLKNSFEKHDKLGFYQWKVNLEKGKTKVNAKQLFPHELVQQVRNGQYDIVTQEQWNVLEEQVCSLGLLENSICVTDVSGSMTCAIGSVKPIDVAIALSLIISNAVKGPFHNNIISFHDTPTFTVIKEDTLDNKIKQIMRVPWGMSTNLMAVFDLILTSAVSYGLKQDEMPKNIFIFSDMQFNDTSTGCTNFQEIERKYKKYNYTRPNIIFWNVNGKTDDFPVSTDSNGTCIISGFSSNIVQALLNGDKFNSYDIMRRTIDSERYNAIRQVLTN
jgi:hypothetical protein